MSNSMLKEDETAGPSLTPGQIIEEMVAIRDEKAALAVRTKELNEQWNALEAAMMALGDSLGMKRMSSDLATASITTEIVPMVDDWDAVYAHILENDACYLLQRRVSTAAYRELQDAGIEIPGLSPYEKRKVSIRKK